MPVDAQLQPVLEMMNAMPMPDLATVDAAAWRASMRMPPAANPEPVAAVADRQLPGPSAQPLTVRVFTPQGQGPFPLLVFFHGGGFVLCDLDSHDALCRRFCNLLQAVVVSVDYRLAPEHPFPAAPEDCYAATVWAAAHAGELNGDGQRLLVAGDSAGGCLAAVVCQMARARGGPAIAHQLLLYPVTDCAFDTPSYCDNSEGYFLTRALMQWFWQQYLPDPALAADPLAAPLRAGDLSGLPPATVITAGYDPLRDEGEAYARALQQAGVPVRLRRYDGAIHGFLAFADLDISRQALSTLAADVQAVLPAVG